MRPGSSVLHTVGPGLESSSRLSADRYGRKRESGERGGGEAARRANPRLI